MYKSLQMYHAEKAHGEIGFGLLKIHIVYNCLRHLGGAGGEEPFTTAEIYVHYLAAVSLTWPHWSITSGDEWPWPCDGTSNSHWLACLLISFCLHPPLAKSETSKDCRKNLTLVHSELALNNAFCLSISLHHCAGCPWERKGYTVIIRCNRRIRTMPIKRNLCKTRGLSGKVSVNTCVGGPRLCRAL